MSCASTTIMTTLESNADRPYLIDGETGDEWTYREFGQRARAFAAELGRLGLRRGDRVGLLLPNCAEYPVIYFGCLMSGVVAVPFHVGLSDAELAHVMGIARCSLILYSADLADRVTTGAGAARELMLRGGKSTTGVDVWTLEEPSGFVPFHDASSDDLGAIMFTSGTTARPKGVAHRSDSLFRNATAFAEATGLDHECRFLADLPMAYMAGFLNLMVMPFVAGGSTVVASAFDARAVLSFWRTPDACGVDSLWFTPSILALLLRGDRGTLGETFCRSKLRFAFVGTAPLSQALSHDFEKRYGATLLESYGLSETLFVTTRTFATPATDLSVGTPIPGVELELRGRDGQVVADGEEGEVSVRTPDLMAGYLDPESGLPDGIAVGAPFFTGDLGILGEGGALAITGRIKDLVIRGGVNISPKAIEEELLCHEAILEVAVVGVPHELYGEDVVAVVRLRPGYELESVRGSLVTHAAGRLAISQQPSTYFAIDEFPCSSSGKIQKHRVREYVVNALGAGWTGTRS